MRNEWTFLDSNLDARAGKRAPGGMGSVYSSPKTKKASRPWGGMLLWNEKRGS